MPSAMPPRFSRHGTPGESPISKNPSRMGFSPQGVPDWVSALKQEELNARISFLQKTAARHAARTSQEIAAIKQRWAEKQLRDKEKALADLIPDVHGWHNTFSLAELRQAHGKIQSTLDYWKVKGYDLATDSNLHTFMAEVEQKSNSWRTPEHSKPDSKRTRHGKFSRTHIANYSTMD